MGVTIKNSRISTNDFFASVSKGEIDGQETIVIEGLNSDIDSQEEDLWNGGADLVYLSSEETMTVTSSDGNDVPAGTGAQSVIVVGINDLGERVIDSIALGATGVVPMKRVIQIFVTAGSGLTNAGLISVTASGAATLQATVQAGYSISFLGFYTVPANKRTIIKQIEYDTTKLGTGGNDPLVNFKVYVRQGTPGATWFVLHERRLDSSVQDQLIIPFPMSNLFVAGADIRITATSDQNNTEARAKITLLQYSE